MFNDTALNKSPIHEFMESVICSIIKERNYVRRCNNLTNVSDPSLMSKAELVEVSHISKKGTSLRLSIPKKVAERIRVGGGDIVGFYTDGERIWLEKMK